MQEKGTSPKIQSPSCKVQLMKLLAAARNIPPDPEIHRCNHPEQTHFKKKYTFKLIATYSKINILPSSWYSWHSPYLSSHGQQVQPTEPWGRIAIPHLAKAGNFTKYNVPSLACSNWFKEIWVEHKVSHRPKEEFHWLPMGLGLKDHPNTPRMPFSVKDLEILPEKSFTLALHHSLQIRYTNLYSQRARSLLWRGLS